MANNTITVFEHSTLHIGEQGFGEYHFNALVKYNDLHGSKYFVPGYRKISFKSYVGVIQAGDKVIEVLPKADRLYEDNEKTKNKWQRALLYMLRKAGYIKLNETEQASQQSRKNNLLDIYLHTYLREVEQLVHAGLVKKYHKVRQNKTALKGRLLIEKQIIHNTIHKERFFTEHTVYDRNNNFNTILKKALEIIQLTCTNSYIKQNASKQLLTFENINTLYGHLKSLDQLVFDRKTKPYTYAIELAKMIILNYSPDMSSGNKPILAILFDMNRLFEKFIYQMLKREERAFIADKLSVTQQNSQIFWKDKTIRPDLVIDFEKTYGKKMFQFKFIVDTKWKIIDSNNPSDDDLKQMYAYNFQFGSQQSILLYPFVGQKNSGSSKYEKSHLFSDFEHACEIYFIELFTGDFINENFSNDFIQYLLQNGISIASKA
jgi:5-methylcytosine-specific restriction enzyme subunit McrC